MPTEVSKPRRSRVDRRTRDARAEGLDAREELLGAAMQVFAERGYREASIDEIVERAGYSKGALYWHFSGKDDLFFALLEERLIRPWREGIELLASAPPDQDMAPEASARFVDLLRGQRDMLLVEHEFWSLAVRDPELADRYNERRRELRAALAKAIAARIEHLGAPPLKHGSEQMAVAFISLASGLAQEKLVDPDAVPDNILGDTLGMIYAGHLAQTQASAESQG
jgi:AcrR family transcriptional regulator